MRICAFRIVITSCVVILLHAAAIANSEEHNFADALSKSLLFFEGQRSGKLPPTQRLTWRKDSGLTDGADKGVDLVGGYYDAGDNVKYNFPMAFTTTMLAWGMQEYGESMGASDAAHALDAIRWATDYFWKCTETPGVVYAGVGDPNADHNCWERPEDMDTPRTTYVVNTTSPGSEVSAEMAAAMAAASLAFTSSGDKKYARWLLKRAGHVFEFADRYRGSYNDSLGNGVCPFYCDFNGFQDELLWAAAWLHKATGKASYWDYIMENIENFKQTFELNLNEFGWDAKNAGISVLLSKYVLDNKLENSTPFIRYADFFVCSIMPESPTKNQLITPGGLLISLQSTSSRSFLLLTYALSMQDSGHILRCNDVVIPPQRLIEFAKTQVNYILGDNPLNISYMVGYGEKYPQRIHHRGSSMPSIDVHPQHIECKDGTPYFRNPNPNPNQLTGAVVGGPNQNDEFVDDRTNAGKLEPTTYICAPLVGLFAFFKGLLHQ